jgi:hypothetical protein
MAETAEAGLGGDPPFTEPRISPKQSLTWQGGA